MKFNSKSAIIIYILTGGVVMESDKITLNQENCKKSHKIKVDDNKLITKFMALSSKILLVCSSDEPTKTASYILGGVGDFIEIIGCFSLSNSIESMMWTLIKNSLYHATVNIINDTNLRFESKTLKWNIEESLKKAGKVSIDLNFLKSPSESEFSNFYCNRLCEWLLSYINEEDVEKIRKSWPMFFTNAITTEWRSDQKYNQLLYHLDTPFNEHLKFLNELKDYNEKYLNFPETNVFDEPINLEQIYVDIFGTASHKQRLIHKIVNVQLELCKWANDAEKDMCIVSGDPGSGKSTVMKMLASTLSKKGNRVVFIDLYKLNFSEKKSAIDVLEEYINGISWLKKYDIKNGVPLILILDGLDEIKVDVWNNAQELVEELHNSIWFERHKVIISGRKKIIDYCSSKCEYSLKIEMLPLKLTSDELKILRHQEYSKLDLLDETLQETYWNKLLKAFDVEYKFEDIRKKEHLNELCSSPLMLFLLVWTIKNSKISIKTIHHSVELYEAILESIYSRKYNRNKYDRIHQSYEEYKKMLAITGLCAWQSNSKCIEISHIEDYCIKANLSVLFKQWIDYHQTNNPSKLLLLFFFREKLNIYSPNDSEIEFIHKSFFEFLAAITILDSVYNVQKKKDNDFYYDIYNIFSKSLIGVEIQEFIEGLLEYRDEYDLCKYAEAISSIIPRIYNANWPIVFYQNRESKKIETSSYTELKQAIKNIEENFVRLAAVLSRIKKRKNISIDSHIVLHLECSNFNNVNWMWNNLSNNCFSGTEFDNAVLTGCDLYDGIFNNCSFAKTNLNSCNMSDSELRNCEFISTHMEACVLENSDISDSNFDEVILEGGYLGDAIFNNTILSGTTLVASNLDNTKFINCKFTNVNFERAILDGTTFTNIEWIDCIMENAKLIDVDMSEFNLEDDSIIEMLSEADLSKANWEQVNVEIKNKVLNSNKYYKLE